VANDEGQEPVAAPRRRGRPPRHLPEWPPRLRVVADPAVGRPMDEGQLATVVGRHCEAGDVLAADVVLPAGLRPGDLLAVACTGAYHHSMASNYNLVGRPPVVAVRDGAARLLVRRETASDMRVRDVGL
jgi:diaminopimelate decarboxylase